MVEFVNYVSVQQEDKKQGCGERYHQDLLDTDLHTFRSVHPVMAETSHCGRPMSGHCIAVLHSFLRPGPLLWFVCWPVLFLLQLLLHLLPLRQV